MGAVEQVAAEIGIPPERVREAALGIGRGASAASAASATRHVEGMRPASDGKLVTYQSAPDVEYAKQRMRASRILPIQIPESRLPELIPVIEDELDLIGHVSIVGRTLTWSPAAQGAEGRQIVVTVRPRGEGTEVHLDERLEFTGWRQAAPGMGAGFGMLFGLFLALMMGLQEAALLVTAVPSGALGAWMAFKGMENTMVDTRRPELQKLLERLSAAVEGTEMEPATLKPGEQK